MDFNRLNKIVEDFIKDKHNKVYIDNLSYVVPLCEKVINRKDFLSTETKEFSTYYDLNKQIELVSSFLGTLDVNLKDQFDTLIKAVDEDENPVINFDSKDRNYAINGKAFIKVENNLCDMFMVLHETLHVMNDYQVVDEKNNDLGENNTRKYYAEAVSITAEKQFGDYLVKNNYITENDYNILWNKRLVSSKTDAQAIIIESILIDMKKSRIEINLNNIKTYLGSIELSEAQKEAIEMELERGYSVKDILRRNEMQFPFRQRYLIAQTLLDKLNAEDLVNLNYEVGNKDANLSEVTSTFRGK